MGAPNAGGMGQNRRLSTNNRLYLENGTSVGIPAVYKTYLSLNCTKSFRPHLSRFDYLSVRAVQLSVAKNSKIRLKIAIRRKYIRIISQ